MKCVTAVLGNLYFYLPQKVNSNFVIIMDVLIKRIFPSEYPNNKKIIFAYQSNFYYDIKIHFKPENLGWIFDWSAKQFNTPFVKHLEENFITDYKENAEYYCVLTENGGEVGFLCIGYSSWNNKAVLWDIYVDSSYQRLGIGTQLINFAEQRAKSFGSRVIVLECQSSNYNAIMFYKKNGYELTGFDLLKYSNQDMKINEIGLEMSKLLAF